ncbi:nitronate monooxygenase [bacterium BMS3Abin01]|nr:nitronate monooxygenase [bacterium BMS3Abin01]
MANCEKTREIGREGKSRFKPTMKFPQIIQGGMGAGVSGWRLVHAVSSRGHIGVVSGIALDLILARRLQLGDPGGHMQRALAAFPDQSVSRRIIDRYYIAGGKPSDQPFAAKPVVGDKLSRKLEEMLVAANFAEVFLAKEGHDGMVGINYLNEIQAPLLPSLYGAMLAGVDIVIVGAGIPVEIPKILDGLFRCETVDLKLHVREVESGHAHRISFNPKNMFAGACPPLRHPLFFPIVSSVTLANLLVKRCEGQVDGFIIEGPSAGGHNAPPRGHTKLSPEGEPVYGPRDVIDLAAIESLGRPFWLAGSYGSPKKLAHALAVGAAGIQAGTIFAFCEESGIREDLKRDVIKGCQGGTMRIFTDPVASPTGFPFKVLAIPGTLSDSDLYAKRRRQCDLGYLREVYERPDGTLGWRCPAEDPEQYVRKGGTIDDTVGRKCLCNGLMANIGMAQTRSDNTEELPLVTCGDDLSGILQVLSSGKISYTAADVVDFLLACNET